MTHAENLELMQDFKKVMHIVNGDDVLYNHFYHNYIETQWEWATVDTVNHIYGEHFIHASNYGMKEDKNDLTGSLEPKEWFVNVTALRTFLLKWDKRYKEFKIL